jgi:hypothetical protein
MSLDDGSQRTFNENEPAHALRMHTAPYTSQPMLIAETESAWDKHLIGNPDTPDHRYPVATKQHERVHFDRVDNERGGVTLSMNKTTEHGWNQISVDGYGQAPVPMWDPAQADQYDEAGLYTRGQVEHIFEDVQQQVAAHIEHTPAEPFDLNEAASIARRRAADVDTCGWEVTRNHDDGYETFTKQEDCESQLTKNDDSGFACRSGHSHESQAQYWSDDEIAAGQGDKYGGHSMDGHQSFG